MMLVQVLLFLPLTANGLFLHHIKRMWSPDPTLEADCAGQCMVSMSCTLYGGVNRGSCGGLFQVCCLTSGRNNAGRKLRFEQDLDGNALSNKIEDYGPVESEEGCGKPSIAARRVVGGTKAGFGSFPWQALVRVGSSRCGGALIHKNWVVTAGHCVHTAWTSSVRVYLGEYKLYSTDTDIEPYPRQKFYVEKIVVHPFYQFTPQADRFDVALLQLDHPAEYSHHVSPICLPPPSFPNPPGTRAFVTGWGATDPNSSKRPRTLQAVDVITVNSTKCETWHRNQGIRVSIYDEMFCAGHKEGGKDACQGDSGGPLSHKDQAGTWTLTGLVSAGYSCAKPGQPGIYHRVSKTASWISHVVRKK